MASSTPLSSLRKLSHELRHIMKPNKLVGTDAVKFMMGEARKHDVSEDRTCQARREMSYVADVYASYLNSSRLYRNLQTQYSGKEKSIEEAANTVGLDVPKKPT